MKFFVEKPIYNSIGQVRLKCTKAQDRHEYNRMLMFFKGVFTTDTFANFVSFHWRTKPNQSDNPTRDNVEVEINLKIC